MKGAHQPCTGTPISWLALEQYHLGELPKDEETQVQSHLTDCPVCSECLDTIRTDRTTLRPLPKAEEARPKPLVRLRPAFAMGGAFAVAGLIALVVFRPSPKGSLPESQIVVKGGDLAITLVRNRGGAVERNARTFRLDDTWKIEVTCPIALSERWEVVVYQPGEVSFPFPPSNERLTCGNRVGLGAFRLTTLEPATICFSLGPGLRERQELGRALVSDLTVCETLDPAL